MAEEEFDPADMPTTSRYRIPYPGPDNLVRFAADQFGAMANAIDTQLGNVDDRQTDAARSTIVRNTLAELQEASAAQGQFGYVTADPVSDNIGIWIYSGDTWSRVSGATPLTVVKNTLAELQAVTNMSEGVFGLVTADPIASNNGAYIWYSGQWSPITAAAGKALTAETLESLEATTAPTGTLGYVTSDAKKSNIGVYVRSIGDTWDMVGGGNDDTFIFTDLFRTAEQEMIGQGEYMIVDVSNLAICCRGSLTPEVVTAKYKPYRYKPDTEITVHAIKLRPGVYDSFQITGYSVPSIDSETKFGFALEKIAGKCAGTTDLLIVEESSTFIVRSVTDANIRGSHTFFDAQLSIHGYEPVETVSGTPAENTGELVWEFPYTPPEKNRLTSSDDVVDAPGDIAADAADTPTDATTETAADDATGQTTTETVTETTTTPAVAHKLPEWPTTGTEAA